MEYWSLKNARIGMARVGIDSIEIGLYMEFLAQKQGHSVCFLEVSNRKKLTRGEIIMNPK